MDNRDLLNLAIDAYITRVNNEQRQEMDETNREPVAMDMGNASIALNGAERLAESLARVRERMNISRRH